MKTHLRTIMRRAKQVINLNNGVLLVALLVASTWIWNTVEAIGQNFTLQQQVDTLAEQIEVEELQNKTLQLQKAYYNTDQYLDLSARERLGLASPGEKALVLPANTVKPAPAIAAATTDPAATRSNFAQWMYFLFGKKG